MNNDDGLDDELADNSFYSENCEYTDVILSLNHNSSQEIKN